MNINVREYLESLTGDKVVCSKMDLESITGGEVVCGKNLGTNSAACGDKDEVDSMRIIISKLII